MKEIGAWMHVNSEAIYGTRPIAPYKEGQVVFTRKDKNVYAIYLTEDEGDGLPARILFSGLKPKSGSKIYLLGFKQPMKWKTLRNGTTVIEIPETAAKMPPCQNAFAFKFQLAESE